MGGEIFNRDGVCHYRDPTGREWRMSDYQRWRRFQAETDERRHDTTLAEVARQKATRSLDVPNSKEARLVPVDYKAARKIRDCLMPYLNEPPTPQESENFYTGRMNQAIAYIAQRRQVEYGSKEWREIAAFLWMIYTNWRAGKRAETLAALGISQETYFNRVARLQAHFDDPEWAAYLICCALSYGVNQRKAEEQKGGVLPPDWLE